MATASARELKWFDEERVARKAYLRYLGRNASAGYEVHGHDQEDYKSALEESTIRCAGPVELAELKVAALGMKYFTWWECRDWNLVACKVLANDYFPLLRDDDMAEYGDRVSPLHMILLLLQRDRMRFRDRALTEEEFEFREEYRRVVGSLLEYARVDFSERRGRLAACLTRGMSDEPLHDIRFLWDGKPFEKEVVSIPERVAHPNDSYPYRMVKSGDVVQVKALQTDPPCMKQHNIYTRLEIGDRVKVGRLAMVQNLPVVCYSTYSAAGHWVGEYYLYMNNIEGVKFNIRVPQGWTPYYTPDPESLPAPDPDESARPCGWGLNVYGDCVGLEPSYSDCRVTPRHVADVVALRHLGIVTSQQGKVLLERAWGDFGWYDVFHYIREMGILEEVGGDLAELVDGVLAAQSQAVADYRSGKKAAFGRLMGSVMKACQGRGKPQEVKVLLEQKLGA